MLEAINTMTRQAALPLFEAIELRHSLRSYTGEPLDSTIREKLRTYLETGWEPYPGARTRAVLIEGKENAQRIFKGVIGSYGAVQNAPALIAFVADVDDPFFYEATGFMGEQVVLYATALGLDTCWVGGFFRPDVAGELAGIRSQSERVLAVTPVGNAKEGGMSSLYEGLFKFGAKRKGKRKSVQEISYVEDVEPPHWFWRALEAVRIAPSSFNHQPWHFFYHSDGRISIHSIVEYKEKKAVYPGAPNSSRLCCGIAMAHFRVASRALGIEGRLVPEEERTNPLATFYPDQFLQEDLDAL